jgi:5-methylcytosine-specific restriction endonuclease McrA
MVILYLALLVNFAAALIDIVRRFTGYYPKRFYKRWLNSPVYKKLIRAKVLKRDNYTCQMCGATDKLQVHHKTYFWLGGEWLWNLITLCVDCHIEIHKGKKK